MRARDRGARAYDAVEGSVYREREARAAAFAREASRHVQLLEEEQAALGRAEPEQRVALYRPREDAARVSLREQVGVGPAPGRDDSIGRRLARVWKSYEGHPPE